MRLPDANILVYAFRPDCPEHSVARAWLVAARDDPAPLCLTSAALVAFVRIVTHPRIFETPDSPAAALDFVAALWGAPGTLPVEAGERYPEIFAELCELTRATGNAVPDAHLAAVALESGAELVTHDRGFARFPKLRWHDPLGA